MIQSIAQDQRTFGMVAVSFSMTSMWHLGETICQSPAVPNKVSLHMMLFHGGRKKVFQIRNKQQSRWTDYEDEDDDDVDDDDI